MKNTRVKKLLIAVALMLAVCVAFCSCNASSAKDNGYTVEESADALYDTAPGGAANELVDLTDAEERKLIRTVDITAETKDFDRFITAFEKAISQAGGYIQSQSISNDIYNESMRSGTITARVPSDKLDGFVSTVSESVTVIQRSSDLQDVTDEYIDVESHINALEVEQTALLAMLEKAESLSDVMSIQSRLTEVRGELESYKARQKIYDNQVAYSTVNIYIQEVEKETVTKPGFWQEAGDAISESFDRFVQMLRDAAIFFIAALPYTVSLAVIIAVVLIIVKSVTKASRKKKEHSSDGNTDNDGGNAQ